MATPAKSLSALLQQSSIEDHEDVLRACNAALKSSKNDPELLHVRFVALLKLDRYEDALRILEECGDKLKDRTKVERAYALYKVGRFEEAKALANSVGDDRAAKHIEAQASYRSGDFSNAAKLYKDLLEKQDSVGDEESDLRINSTATDAQLEWSGQGELVEKRKPARQDLEAFETAYNTACASIGRGELGQGEVLLKRAKSLCTALDDLSEQDKTAEILPILVQQLYVLSRLGKTTEAEALASEISVVDIPDLATQKIAQNNLIASKEKSENPYLNRRLLDTSSTLPTTNLLFSYQSEGLQQNNLTLDLQAQKPKAVIRASETILKESQPTTSAHINTLSVLNAAAHAQSDLANTGLEQILPLFEKRSADVGLALTIVQLYILTNNHGSAITVLEKLLSHIFQSTKPSEQDVLYAPGLVALQVSLYSTQNRKSQIKTALAKAASYWRRKPKPPTTFLQAAGTSLLDSSLPDHQNLARDIFSTLHTTDPDSKLSTAGYIASHASTSISSITEADLSTLPPLSQQIKGIDVSALEEAGIPSLPSATTTGTTPRKRPLDEKPKPVKKRHRHSRLPKDLDPGKKPDPERWLPLRDRSSYKPKRKGKRREGERERTQGGINEKPVEKGAELVKGNEKPGGGGGGGGKAKKEKKKGKK